MDWLSAPFDGWAGFFSLTFHGDLLLMLVAGLGFAVVARAALKDGVHARTRAVVLAGAVLISGLMLAKGLGWLD